MLSTFQCNFYAKILLARGFCVEIFDNHLVVDQEKYQDDTSLDDLVKSHPRKYHHLP